MFILESQEKTCIGAGFSSSVFDFFLLIIPPLFHSHLSSLIFSHPRPLTLGEVRLLFDWRSVSQYVLVSSTLVGFATRYLLPVGKLLSEICGLVSVGCSLWQEDGSAICSVITQWSKSRRTHNHTLLSHLRLPQPGGPGFRIYISQEHGGQVALPCTGIFVNLFYFNPTFFLIIYNN
jgi:hypothetical protein